MPDAILDATALFATCDDATLRELHATFRRESDPRAAGIAAILEARAAADRWTRRHTPRDTAARPTDPGRT